MNNGPKYFRLAVYGKAWGSIEQLSHLVFEIKRIYIIWHRYITSRFTR